MPEDVRPAVVGEAVLPDEDGAVDGVAAPVEADVAVVVEGDELERLLQVDVAAPVEARLLRVLVPGEVEVQVASPGTGRPCSRRSPAGRRGPRAPPPGTLFQTYARQPRSAKPGFGIIFGRPSSRVVRSADLLPAREGDAVRLQDLRDAAVEHEPEVVDGARGRAPSGTPARRASPARRRRGPRRRPCGGCAGARRPRGGGPRGPAPRARRTRRWRGGPGSSRCRGRRWAEV